MRGVRPLIETDNKFLVWYFVAHCFDVACGHTREALLPGLVVLGVASRIDGVLAQESTDAWVL